MGIHLYEHNQKAYDAAVSMMEREGKAAIIHPTGTGKSFIAFKLACDYPDARICWLAPSEYIFKTQLENLKRGIQEKDCEFPNLRFFSYSKLMMNEDKIEDICPHYIVLDEFHRCGASEWGKSVRKLLDTYPHAKILGLSATNIRYLDNQRDMAQEIFEGHIASEMTLGEAIARGILPTPKYVISLYSVEKELEKLQKKIAAQEHQSAFEDNRKLLQQLRRALENANGPAQIFQKHMPRKNGKYIVFCADKEHMDEMQELVEEWFGAIDREAHVYTAYYNNPETSKEFLSFKKDNSNHLKLLFCIDMLNEGVHVDDVDGVILLRPTVSPIIYLQQIGRSLSAGTGKQPVIFDLVNNFNSLSCIDYLEQEVTDAYSLMPCVRGEGEKYPNRFFIIDEVRDCRILIGQLQRNLSSSWDIYYGEAQKYYLEKGHLRIPKSYITSSGLSLGNWIQTQRKVCAGTLSGDWTEERKHKLDAIGMVWEIKADNWERGYGELLSYYEEHGNLDVRARFVSDSGFALGKWISNLRANVKKKGVEQVLTKEQENQLKALGMIWNKKNEVWEGYLTAAREYRQTYGDLKVPLKYVTKDGIPLGNWIHSVRHGVSGDKKRKETLSEKQIEQLNELGMDWENNSVSLWNIRFELAKGYFEEHGDLEIPVAYCVDGVKLGRWIANIRSKRKNPHSSGMMLDEERIRALDSIGMNWR